MLLPPTTRGELSSNLRLCPLAVVLQTRFVARTVGSPNPHLEQVPGIEHGSPCLEGSVNGYVWMGSIDPLKRISHYNTFLPSATVAQPLRNPPGMYVTRRILQEQRQIRH